MTCTRREFAAVMAAGLTSVSIQAVAFDAFPIFDPRPVEALAERLYPGRGAELSHLWRDRQFEYAWLRTLSHTYADFRRVTEDALVYAAQALRLELTRENRDALMHVWFTLRCWPDVPAALRSLRDGGLRLGLLSNLSADMLAAGLRNSGLENVFEQVLSTDRVRAYKPDPRAYQMALDAFRLRRESIAFAAFAGWDSAGAAAFGYRTFWVNRRNQPAEELGAEPAATGSGMNDLVAWLRKR